MFRATTPASNWNLSSAARDDIRRYKQFERDLRRNARGGFHGLTSGVNSFTDLAARAAGAGALHELRRVLGLTITMLVARLPRAPWRRMAQVAALAGASSLALASVLVAQGYVERDPAWVKARLAQRLGSMVYGQDHRPFGVLYAAAVDETGTPVDHQSYGWAHGLEAWPDLYKRLVLRLEHQHHFSARNTKGTDLLSMIKRVATGTGGGSGLAPQLSKQLIEPDEKPSDSRLVTIYRKFKSIGTAAAVHDALGGAQGVFDTFVAYAPVAQVNGTTRGPEAGSQVIFGVPLAQASPAQLAVLASLVQRPLALVDARFFKPGCAALRAMRPADARAAGRDTQVARGQCLTLARARVALKAEMPPGPTLDQALTDIEAMERTGLQPVDAFAPLPTRNLMAMSVRAQSTMGPAVLQHLAEEVDARELPVGAPILLSLNASEHPGFRAEVLQTLKTIDATAAAQELLCVKLAATSGPRHCAGVPEGYAQAEVLLARARVADGGITRLYLSSPAVWNHRRQTGSLAKLVIVVAALAAGYNADSPVCPRAASDNGRPLRRDAAVAPYGFSNCRGHLVPRREATATSDSLVYYDLARQLGPQRLLAAARALGLDIDDELAARPAFVLAFGTLEATPEQMLQMGQAVFALAYGVPVQARAPQLLVLVLDSAAPPLAYLHLQTLLPAPEHRHQLSQLLQAPVVHPRGTLHALGPAGTTAGKSGTTSSDHRPAAGLRPYVQAKLALTWQPQDRSVSLSIVAGAEPQPLAQARLPGALLNPLRQALVR
jgi:membrane peptidoglycan carboxypeptidase